ncbi:MAG: hypothetical protein IPM79_36770 [Polyangiaceae bacterium]|jgi:hypothetical protein|nr:hypothetical protein [Polyangiaceae bacterium]MBK8943008.1 hypothetical protein [Polyangiaceae bacterium]
MSTESCRFPYGKGKADDPKIVEHWKANERGTHAHEDDRQPSDSGRPRQPRCALSPHRTIDHHSQRRSAENCLHDEIE